ncbi:PHP domain-containing protein [Bacillus sp. FJAT-49705]|uniref:PHP domain-containing protein n=1 Tax=Cytobacillus citreus TaxID=2833586 RepID=A0ABS5NXL4_9BACI|nr:PHP domain-containing protein [Cytobacillus citreus]MBS4192566.1 PHP domain-containing protein [Cytobacillus citreus]
MKVELHCHTRISDGSSTFAEILELAVEQGVSHIAITNHDTTRDLKEMMEIGKEKQIEIIPGIEISGFDFKRNRRVHILGYFIEPDHASLLHLCQPFSEKRSFASMEMVTRLIAAGYSITWERCKAIAKGGTGVYKQHIMQALIEAGYTDSIYGDLYKKLFNRGGNGEQPGIAFVPIEYVDAKLAVKAIIDAGGVPVLAHPGQYRNFEMIPELVELGLQGIEVWHPLHTKEDEGMAMQFAEHYHLIMTGGSDFHGAYGEKEVLIGSKSPGIECVNALKTRIKPIVKSIL